MYMYRQTELNPNVVQYRRVGMWNQADAPAAGSPGDGTTSISVSLRFKREEDAQNTGVIQLVVFHAEQLRLIGADWENGGRVFCCSAELAAHQIDGCDTPGLLIVRDADETRSAADEIPRAADESLRATDEPEHGQHAAHAERAGAGFVSHSSQSSYSSHSSHSSHSERGERGVQAMRAVGGDARLARRLGQPAAHASPLGPWVHDISFGANQSEAAFSGKMALSRSGVYYLLLSSCEPETGLVLVSGHTTWQNPYGYLPGELYPFLPFFGLMCFMYAELGCGCLALCLKHRTVLLPLQTHIGAVLVLGLIETGIWYLDYSSFNSGGSRGVAPVVLGALISASKKTLSRLLVLAVCLGYGVVRPTLGSVAYQVLALGVVYFIFSAIFDVFSNISQISEVSVPLRLLLILPVASLDAFFYWWVFSGLTRTLAQLSTRRQTAKLTLYRRFSSILLASICISGLWVSWQMGVIVSGSLDSRWTSLWMFDAFWHVLYFGILLAICYLWSPSKSNLQYAYMDELGQEEEEEEETEPAERNL